MLVLKLLSKNLELKVFIKHLNYLVEIKKPDYDLIVEELESLFELEENA